MRSKNRILLASCGAALAFLPPAAASAQSDVTPHLPNVLLLIDNSGSMEYLVDTVAGVPVTPETSGDPNAACTLTGSTTVMTRWAALVSALTGSFQAGAFGCETLTRTENKFVTEFGLPGPNPGPPGSNNPYDYAYFLPWHRIYSNGCTIGALQPMHNVDDWTNWPGNPPGNPYDYHTNAGPCHGPGSQNAYCCNWSGQNNDGILDTFLGMARFGLMTLDTLPDPGTGSTLTNQTRTDYNTAAAGMWSYFHGWWNATPPANLTSPLSPNTPPSPTSCTQTTAAAGNPASCSTPRYMEVGARNPAAPPWEGPMVPFGDPTSDSAVSATNQQIQLELLAMRPYGATPLAGLLDDANEFLFGDQNPTFTLPPGDPHQFGFGPSGPNHDGTHGDQQWKAGCRRTFNILLTDGGGNLDLRGPTGQCDATGGNPAGRCPYLPADQIITQMRTNIPLQSVSTYVVGFAMSNPAALAPLGRASCADLTATDCDTGPPNHLPPAGLEDCCQLQKLAVAGAYPNDPVFQGNPVHAFFADNPTALKQALSTILSQGLGNATARTAPVYFPAGPANAQGSNFAPPAGNPALSYHFIGSFNVTAAATGNVAQGGGANGLWSGNLKRERYACVNGSPVAQAIDQTHGDDFAHNLDIATVGSRNFFTVIAPRQGNQINSDQSIRPGIVTDDGFGTYGSGLAPMALVSGTQLPNVLSSGTNYEALGIQSPHDGNCHSAFGLNNNPSLCAQYITNWEVGGINGALGPSAPSRDPTSTYCNAVPNRKCSKLGAIYHSSPAVTGPPHEFLRDDTYTTYANNPTYSGQPLVLYSATLDGQLHAFKVSDSVAGATPTDRDSNNNELWSFIPPAVLQHILTNYNSGAANLLDGAPVVADVPGLTAVGVTPPIFERTPGSAPNWHRVLVASGGQAGGFYYALDVTDPQNPTFLWQLSSDSQGNPMFGAQTPTPAIAIVAITENNVRTQVPVAILPGGSGTLAPGGPPGPPCHPPTQASNQYIQINDPQALNPSNRQAAVWSLTGGYQPPDLRCWTNNGNNNQGDHGTGNFNNGTSATGNSLTIVRLDTGSVLVHFTGVGYFGANGNGGQGDQGDHGHHGHQAATQPFTAPLTGVPVPYPSQTGQVADRVYIGDGDGQLWRIDLSYPDPTQWTVNLAWDAYLDAHGSQRDGLNVPPVISTDPVGNLVILMATGDQNLLTATSSDQRVWSITESPLNHYTSQNWYIRWSPTQGHVTGPMAVFNDILYFATYTPQTSNACSPGTADLWGVDFRRPKSTGLPLDGLTNPTASFAHAATDGSIIFGVSTTELPSCGGTQTTSDPYFGSHSQVSGVAQSEYRLMWQTGAGSGVTGNGVRNEGTVSAMQNMTLPSPAQSTKIDAWAAIIE